MISSMNKRASRQTGMSTIRRQAGVTLMETMIALALSVVVTSAMVILMANSLGTATRVIQMSQLSDELRNAMSMMTRDVRRANYSAYAPFCYGNSNCGAEGGIAEQAGDIQMALIGGDPNHSCFLFTLDRGFDGNANNDPVGGFRWADDNGVGVIQMWTRDENAAPPQCNADAGWVAVTDPDRVNITVFAANDDASVSKVFNEGEDDDGEDKFFTSRQRQLEITLRGQLLLEEARNAVIVTREIADTIYVRNDFVILPAS